MSQRRRSNKSKREQVVALLHAPESSCWPVSKIASTAKVTRTLVYRVLAEYPAIAEARNDGAVRRLHRNRYGRVGWMNVSHIGRSPREIADVIRGDLQWMETAQQKISDRSLQIGEHLLWARQNLIELGMEEPDFEQWCEDEFLADLSEAEKRGLRVRLKGYLAAAERRIDTSE